LKKFGRRLIYFLNMPYQLYQEGVRIPHYAAGLQYSRWGLIGGGSAESVIKELRVPSALSAA
jgi:hypothetical protein